MKNDLLTKKNILIATFAIFFIVFIALIIALNTAEKEEAKKNNITISYENLKTIKEVVEYHKSKYISESKSNEEDYKIDVMLEFRYDLYDEEKSNETFFNNIIKDIAKVSKYVNFRLIDESKNITIEVICINSKVNTIIINGVEDYFIYKDSQISLSKYIEITKKEFQIESPIIINLINSGWNKDINFGTRDSIYNSYNIYFDEGISVRNIDSKVYNVVFSKKYNGNVVDGIYPGMELSSVEDILGKPHFENEEKTYIGYKGQEIYVFFSKDEISVYRIEKKDMTEFFELMDKFLKDEIEFLDLMNEMTYMWPDYTDYDYTDNSIFLSYPNNGIDIKINYDNTTGIIFYNNVNEEISKIEKYLDNTNFMGLLQIDNVDLLENRRLKLKEKETNELKEYKEKNKEKYHGYSSSLYDCYSELDSLGYPIKMKFLSKTDANPNREITDAIDSFIWVNDMYFIYSKKKSGIYFYDLTNGNIQNLISGSDDYEIKEFSNGMLKFDNTEVLLEF